jgi:hypothetical protein
VWVHNAFGPALALLNLFDCALYPLLLAQYVERALYPLLPPEPHGAHGASWLRELAPDVIGSCLRLAVVALAAGVNVLGTSVVGIGMVAFMFLGGPVIQTFSIAICIGVFVGTYSTVYVAAPTILVMQDLKPWLERLVSPLAASDADGLPLLAPPARTGSAARRRLKRNSETYWSAAKPYR